MERMDCFISFTLEVDDKVGQYQVFFYAMWNVRNANQLRYERMSGTNRNVPIDN